jgi:RNA polymerase sigma factor (sigma-70 family)
MAAHHPGPTTPRRARARIPGPPGRDLVLETIARHGASLLATARRYSLCADDAEDAYQRGLEIFLHHADSLRPEGAPAWLRTVIKHEALAVRATRLRLVSAVEPDLDLYQAGDAPLAEERVAALERLGWSAEALAQLKPQEVRALVLKANGYSYLEICRITGWTYTKVNRCLTEGRQSLRDRLGDIEAGRQCARWEGVLSAAAQGRARGRDLISLASHLRGCGACRASLRAGRMARRRPQLAAARPAGAPTEPRLREDP